MIRKMNKGMFISLIIVLCLCMFACNDEKVENDLVLRVYNWQEYIDEGKEDEIKVANSIMEDWVIDYKERTGKDVKVIYNTFETNEVMLNNLKTGSEHYDLVCPSDYIIQKMISEDLLEKYDFHNDEYDFIENYNLYGSKFIKSIFESQKTRNKVTDEELEWTYYSIPYMWGTMGFIYDADKVELEDVQTWEVLWNEDYKGKSTAKNSIHDTYVAGIMYVYREELLDLKQKYDDNLISSTDYNNKVTEIMNRVDDDSVELVEDALLAMKKNFYGFEVDNGKTDIVSGKTTINFAWSGDAVYAMDTADELNEERDIPLNLNFAIPVEGSNVWFDGWVMPKGANKELAQDFVNFLCDPENASRNMNTIGYTSAIAGDDVWELVNDWYGSSEGEEVDLTYFFEDTLSEEYLTDGKVIIKVEERGRQFDAQYPTIEVINSCGIMKDFGDQNEKVLVMWENIKGGEAGLFLIVGLCVIMGLIAVYAGYKINELKIRNKRRKRHLLKISNAK